MENNNIKPKYSVKLNNMDKIEQLLQETYNLACQQYNAIQNEMNKIANSTVLNDLDIDGKEKYAKAMNNYISLQQKSIAQKFDIAKLMAEVIKTGGDVKGAIDNQKKITSFDTSALRKLAKEGASTDNDSETYKIKNF